MTAVLQMELPDGVYTGGVSANGVPADTASAGGVLLMEFLPMQFLPGNVVYGTCGNRCVFSGCTPVKCNGILKSTAEESELVPCFDGFLDTPCFILLISG